MKSSYKKKSLRTIKGWTPVPAFLTVGLMALIFAVSTAAASPAQGPQDANQGGSDKQYLGPTADTIRPYRPVGRDPFKRDVKPKLKDKRGVPRVFGFPPLEARRMEYRQKLDQARARDLPDPDPVSQYLVSELDITGVFRDERGWGAFVKALPTGTMFFVRGGAVCYNGQVLRIEGDESESGGAKVLFREVSVVEVNGKESRQERVVAKLPGASTKN
ncbi:MAG TPA: hypothetical protein VJH03_06480 [Blastocatellia bacterium]|nr:hypothetical protein [Blastocatellia bacterium]